MSRGKLGELCFEPRRARIGTDKYNCIVESQKSKDGRPLPRSGDVAIPHTLTHRQLLPSAICLLRSQCYPWSSSLHFVGWIFPDAPDARLAARSGRRSGLAVGYSVV